jgi:hypothetical protein
MTQAVAHILDKVRRLSPEEGAELRCAILERTAISDDLPEDHFGKLAAASFRARDEQEGARGA